MVCAVHCAALPFVLGVLPALGLDLLGSEGFERGYVAFAAVLGITSLGWTYPKHRQLSPLAWLIPGLIVLAAGVAIPALHASRVLHAITMTSGGTLVSLAHFFNLRIRRHARVACCRE
jgi:uncharacterized membrane protein YjjB (DUF3815 family)